MAGDVSHVQLTNAEMSFDGLQPSALKAAELMLEGLRLQASLEAADLMSMAGSVHAPVLDALRGMEGRLEAFVTDAAWILDATITLPVHHGRVDFDLVEVEHLGPDSSMGLSAGGLYVDAPQLGRRYLYVFTAALPAGLQTEQREGRRGIADRGTADLPVLLAALLQATQAPGRWANQGAQGAALSRSRLAGELQLGDGELRAMNAGLHLCGHALGANRIALSSPGLDQGLLLRVPQLAATSLQAGLPGWQLHCERIDGQFSLDVDGGWTRDQPLQLTLEAPRLTLRGLSATAPASR